MRLSNVLSASMAIAVLVASPSAMQAAGTIAGHGRFEKIKGKPNMGYVELYETNLFLSPPTSSPVGPSRRLGTTCMNGTVCNTVTITGDGCYCAAGLPAGTYSIIMNQPLFFICPKVLSNVVIQDNQTVTVNPLLPVDYSSYFRDAANQQWTGPGVTWYQTFTATGTGVRGISFNVAGGPAPAAEVALLEDNGNTDVRNWRLVASRVEPQVVQDGDNWVRFRSTETPMVPGRKYAVRLKALVTGTLQPYKRDKDTNSYVGGQAYNELGQAQNFDLTLVVFADNDGTIVTMNRRTTGLGWLCDEGFFGQRWGQSFIAHGRALAGADVWAAGAGNRWDLKFAWKIRENGPGGAQIGPTKITDGAFQSFGAGLHGVSYNANEVPLTPGQTYLVEFSIVNPPPESNGFNPYLMSPSPGASCGGGNDPDTFAEGMAYRDDTPRPDDDVSMTILEYAIPPKLIGISPESISHINYLGDPLPGDTFTVRNLGTEAMSYNITDNASWLSVAPANGVSSGELDPIAISYNLAGLPVGTYNAVISVAASGALNTPMTLPVSVIIETVTPDFDGDTDVDQDDFGFMQKCFSGPGILNTNPACGPADLDKDLDIDATDFAKLLNCVSGANHPANRECD